MHAPPTIMKKLLALTTLGTGLLAFACRGGGDATPPLGTSSQALEALVPLAGCVEVDAYVRDRAKADVNRIFDAMKKQIEESPYGCGGYYGGEEYDSAPTSAAGAGGSSSSGGSSGSSPPPAPKASETSGTNNQVAGVDEADFVKNDGSYLYVVANGAFRIVKAWPANDMSPMAKVAIEGTPKKLFVEGDRAVVYTSIARDTSQGSAPSYGGYGGSRECTYGYECVPSGDGTTTKVLVFDITNRAAPTKIRELSLSGSLLAARRIGGAVHTVVVDAEAEIEGLEYSSKDITCNSTSSGVEEQRQANLAAVEALRQKDLALIDAADMSKQLPTVQDDGAPLAACSGYYRPNLAEGRTFTSLVSFDIAGGTPTTATVVSDPGVVYASETALYMSVPHTQQPGETWYVDMQGEKQASTVHRFRIGRTPVLTGYEASGVVKGRVLNQFALDEHEGNLRVATTTGHAPSPETHSTMSVLSKAGNALVLQGKVDDIAPSEDIRSVRFDGSRGYVVTFKKTDPLYVFDLGNPSKPAITGELKIPGFSTYMHMMDAQHLLTIGYDADDQGSFAWFQGVMLQIFDVADMRNPTLLHKEVIGTRGSSSEALTNHLAFTYYAPKNILALPMTICEGGDGGTYGTNMTFAGLMVYDVTATNGFALRGKVAHPQTSSGGYDSGACSNWWTQAQSEVKRSVIMDDFVYSISEKRVKVNALPALANDIREVSLEN